MAAHFDAIKLLRWCVELPQIDPSEHARAMAFERVLEETAHLASEPEEDGVFWKRLNANVAEQMDGLVKR